MIRLMASALLLVIGLSPGHALAPGDDLAAFFRTRAATYASARVLAPLAGFPGYETAVLATDAGFNKPPFILVLRKSGAAVVTPFGAVEGVAANAVLLLDADGDGRLDLQTVNNLVPGWLGLKVPGARGTGAAFRALADRIYRQYDQSSGPIPAQLTLLMQSLRSRALDPANPDRDLEAALTSALDQALAEPRLAAGTLGALSAALRVRGADHPLPALFRGEALVAIGSADAQAQFDRLLQLDPRSTIGAFKKAQASPGALAAFRKAHPDFWASR